MPYFFILAAIILRIIPHIPNFAPIAAMALFGSVYLNKKYGLILPLIALFLSDILIGFYNPWIMASVYGSFIIIGGIGLYLKKHKGTTNIIVASLFGSVIFFLITNFSVWAIPHSFYPHTLNGLMQSYLMGLPFFKNTVMGDLFYTGAMFGLMEIVIKITNTWEIKKERNGLVFRKMARKRI